MTERQFDRRRRKRTDVSLPVILENATAVTRDASASGVFFWKRGTFMYGESIRFAIERNTESGKILQRCRGVVVRTEPDDHGVGVAAKITESTTDRAPGQPPGPELPESAREEPRDIARPADNATAPTNEAVLPDTAREEPPTITPPADETVFSPDEAMSRDTAREEPPTIIPPTDEAVFSPDEAMSRDTAREELPTIAWPTDEAFFSPDKTVSLEAARGQSPASPPKSDGAPPPASDADSLDFVHGRPGRSPRGGSMRSRLPSRQSIAGPRSCAPWHWTPARSCKARKRSNGIFRR